MAMYTITPYVLGLRGQCDPRQVNCGDRPAPLAN
jgi:hypothetical protein